MPGKERYLFKLSEVVVNQISTAKQIQSLIYEDNQQWFNGLNRKEDDRLDFLVTQQPYSEVGIGNVEMSEVKDLQPKPQSYEEMFYLAIEQNSFLLDQTTTAE